MRCFYQLSEKHPIRIRHTGFGFYAKAVRMEKSLYWLLYG